MNIKKCIFILVIFTIFMGIIAPTHGFAIQKLDKNTATYYKGESKIVISIVSSNIASESKMKKDLDSISKIVVKVDGKTVNTINKGKNWSRYKYYPMSILNRKTIVKGNV
ncbi:MAG: hypothetical protein FWH54_03690, partial [Methanobrevibacter sp.]|nr:hypothetical protein [Methanobrevibacter sp.]